MSEKRPKPSADWPFFWKVRPKGGGYWCRKVGGRQVSYGSDDAEAIGRYNVEVARLTLGITGATEGQAMTCKGAGDLYLNAQLAAVQRGTLKEKTWLETKRNLKRFVKATGASAILPLLGPADFAKALRGIPTDFERAREKVVVDVRAMCNFLVEKRLIPQLPEFGDDFKQLTVGEKRKSRAIASVKKGTRVPSHHDINKLLSYAYTPRQRAELLLAINGGLGAGDLGELRLHHWIKDHHALDFPRPKTGIRRILPLWPATEEALENWINSDIRLKSVAIAKPDDKNRVFLSRNGQPSSRDDIVFDARGVPQRVVRVTNAATRLQRLQRRAGVSGWSFYGLRALARHLWLGAPTSDPTLVRVLMGHTMSNSNDEFYLRAMLHDSLRPYADHAYSQLFPKGVPTAAEPDWVAYAVSGRSAQEAWRKRRRATLQRRTRESGSAPSSPAQIDEDESDA